jgi:HD-GYP domain-containing protein (c-di-GMP phosphodiesterase class II)
MMKIYGDIRAQITADRMETRQEIAKAVALGRPLLADTNLVREGAPIGPHEVVAVRKLIQTIAPVNIETSRLYAHVHLTAKVAHKIGQQLIQKHPWLYPNLNLDELKVLGLFHDLGRFFTHAWLRNELIGSHLLKKLGVREDIIRKIPSGKTYAKKDPNNQEQIYQVLQDLSIEEKIIVMADICSKRKADGGISTFDEVMQYHETSRKNYQAVTGPQSLYPSQRLLTLDVIDFSGKVYRELYTFFDSLGVNLEEIRRNIIEEETRGSLRIILLDVEDMPVQNIKLANRAYVASSLHSATRS